MSRCTNKGTDQEASPSRVDKQVTDPWPVPVSQSFWSRQKTRPELPLLVVLVVVEDGRYRFARPAQDLQV